MDARSLDRGNGADVPPVQEQGLLDGGLEEAGVEVNQAALARADLAHDGEGSPRRHAEPDVRRTQGASGA